MRDGKLAAFPLILGAMILLAQSVGAAGNTTNLPAEIQWEGYKISTLSGYGMFLDNSSYQEADGTKVLEAAINVLDESVALTFKKNLSENVNEASVFIELAKSNDENFEFIDFYITSIGGYRAVVGEYTYNKKTRYLASIVPEANSSLIIAGTSSELFQLVFIERVK